MKKYSVSIRGHRTSYTLEQAFAAELERMAAERTTSIAKLIAEIDEGRPPGVNLASAIRLAILQYVKAEPPPRRTSNESAATAGSRHDDSERDPLR